MTVVVGLGRAASVAITAATLLAALSCSGALPTSAGGAGTTGSGGRAITENAAGAAATGTTGTPVAPSEPAATFTEVYAMLFPMTTNARCVACHSMPPNDIANGNLQMGSDKASAYAALVGKKSMSTRCMNAGLVVPNEPDASLFVQKLSATPPCGSRMPLGGNILTDDQVKVVKSWIAGGAKDD